MRVQLGHKAYTYALMPDSLKKNMENLNEAYKLHKHTFMDF